jgi:acyl-CoA synthetase (AMP-forming)/AMP-acid ligase II
MKLGTMLADCAMRYPDREAMVCGDRRVTFAELDTRASRLANALLAEGQAFGDRVALYLPNGAELVEAMAAVARSGGVIVPISTRLTTGEVRYIFDDCEPAFVFFAPEFREAAYEAADGLDGVRMVAIAEPEAGELGFERLIEAGSPAAPPALPVDKDDLVIGYTSGTTGNPKGAVNTHRNLISVNGFMNSIEWGLGRTDRTLVTTPMAHRTGLGRVTNMLCLGSSLVILPRFDPADAVDLIEREGCTVIGVVPTIARLLLPEIERRPEACRTLRKMLATGEAFPVEVKKRLLAALPDLGIYSFYAQTESGFITSLRPEEQFDHGASCGRAVPGVELRIVDADLKDVADGEAGEVLVRCGEPGEIMTMREYYRLPEATAATIVEGGWIRTGDVCRRDAGGYLFFVDRVKDMIVSGGLNIYSKEVELALIAHPAVADAAVIGVPDDEFGESVLAFVERESGATAQADELIDHCREQIASYKKPKHVRFIDALPRTGTGKVQKQELRRLVASEQDTAHAGG